MRELLPVKRTMKNIKFSRPVAQAAGRFLCGKEKVVLLKGCENAQIALHTPIVIVADVICNHPNQVLLAGKASTVVSFALEDTPETLHRAVVNALGDARHTLRHPGSFQFVMEGSACVLESTVRMEDGMGVWVFLQSLVKGLEYKWIVVSVPNYKGNNAPVIEVKNGAKINLVDFNTFIPLELRYIGQPLFVGCLGVEVPVQHILCNVLRVLCPSCAAMIAVLNGGFDIFLPADPQNSLIVDMNIVVVAKIIIDTAITLVWAIRMDLLNLFCDCFVLNGSGAFVAGEPPVIRSSGYL